MRTNLRRVPAKAVLSFCCLLLVASTAQGAGSKPKKEEAKERNPAVSTSFNIGIGQMEAGSYEDAAASFQQALAMDPDYAEAHNNFAYCLRKLGKDHYDDALTHYNKALELNPKLAAAYHYRGVLHALSGHEDAAKADHAKLLELDRELADELMKVIASGEEPEGKHGAVWK